MLKIVAAALLTAAAWPAMAMIEENPQGDPFPYEAMQPYAVLRAALVKAGWHPGLPNMGGVEGYSEVYCGSGGMCWAMYRMPEAYIHHDPIEDKMIFQLQYYPEGGLRVVPEMYNKSEEWVPPPRLRSKPTPLSEVPENERFLSYPKP